MEDWGEFYIMNGKLLIKEEMAQEYINRLTDKNRGSLLGSIKRALRLQG